MKNSIKSIAAIVLALSLNSNSLLAHGNHLNILSDSAWQEIEESTETENKLLFEEMDAKKTVSTNSLQLDFAPGKYTNSARLILDAPLANSQEVGVAVIDAEGVVVYSAAGTFGEVKNLNFDLYSHWDMTYVIKIYSENEVYESKMQVVYR